MQIENRTRRSTLAIGKRHWQMLEPGLAIGYRRPLQGGAGSWYVRALVGSEHKVAALGTADDQAGIGMDWKAAQGAARAWRDKQTASGPLTVEQAVADYIADLAARKGQRAAREAQGRINLRLLPVLGNHLVADLTAGDLLGWRNGLVADDDDADDETVRRSRDTANRLLSIAKAALNHAFAAGRVADDRAWRRVKGFKGVGEARKVILSDAALQKLVDACGPGLRELVLLGAWTGARTGELTSARVLDFDRDAATLHVRGKTGERDIHLAPDALALCARLASGKRPDEFLLTTADGTPWTGNAHYRPLAEAVTKAGLDPETTYYALRHTYISRALKQLVPPKAVADQCGTSLMMIMTFYAKFIPSDRAVYAAAAAPPLTDGTTSAKVVPLRG